MGRKKKKNDFDNVKIGDTVLLYYNAKKDIKDPRKNGYVMTDLSGYNSLFSIIIALNLTSYYNNIAS